ncbi:MAG: nuclear transport factor 2 family protein [Archangium sp.]|nr:nuclear transport factor 2 family protein [Archangium sp.]MDP3156528.1 nuclear transport factor 2 family protein [Archangium sp.]MDP3573871.1 nuclear transport factor 2 family protein [Archangium sp.]
MSKSVQGEALPQRVKKFYERISVERDAALEELAKLYSEDVRFINPVVDQRGLSNFEETWKKALRQYKTFEFKNVLVTGTDELFSLTYSMNIKFAIGPTFVTEMATDCHAKDGKIFLCRDYFDPLGTLVGPFAPISWLYKKIFSHLVA